MKHRVDELEGRFLDLAVALADGLVFAIRAGGQPAFELPYDPEGPAHEYPYPNTGVMYLHFKPSMCWNDAGPIIEREHITIGAPGFMKSGLWEAFSEAFLDVVRNTKVDLCGKHESYGQTPLLAAMRCYVRSKFGEFVELPEVTS